jgi:PIN domain nuclease of toxin-antitoxin system
MLFKEILNRNQKVGKGVGWAFCFLLLFALIWQSCSGLNRQDPAVNNERPPNDVLFFKELDRAVNADGVQERSSFPIGEFPYLRTNRFLVAMKNRIESKSEAEFWVAEMMRLALEARRKEIYNLQAKSLYNLAQASGEKPDRMSIVMRMVKSAENLASHDRQQPDFYQKVKEANSVPDVYSTAMRILGLYPLVSMPVTLAAKNANQKFIKWHQESKENLPVEGQLVLFRPLNNVGLSEDDVARIFKTSRRNPFGLPALDDKDIRLLAHAFAPIIDQDVVADYDRFGEVEWRNNQVTVDPSEATVYYYLTRSFINQRPVFQVNYVFWYSERSGKKSPAYEKGPLDGITIRVSLNHNGEIVMVDAMNSCGCYHFYAPRKGMVKIKKPFSQSLYPFVVTWLPDNYPENHLMVRVNSGWHQIENLYAEKIPPGSATYKLESYDVLESLPRSGGRMESVFDSKGIMKNSWRIEPYILFSMGIPRIGYMRQRSHHAIHIVGRTHFTDPDILDRYFVFR